MDVEVKLQISDIDLTSEIAAAVFGGDFADSLVEQVDEHMGYVTVFVAEGDVVNAAIRRVNQLRRALPAAKIEKVDRDLVGATDIAWRVGVSREAARKWAKMEGFPTPQAVVGTEASRRQRLWAWVEVLQWLRETRNIEMDENPASIKEIVAIENYLAGNTMLNDATWHAITNTRGSARSHSVRRSVARSSALQLTPTVAAPRGRAQDSGTLRPQGSECRRAVAGAGRNQ